MGPEVRGRRRVVVWLYQLLVFFFSSAQITRAGDNPFPETNMQTGGNCAVAPSQDDGLDTLMWFKLLFVPTLGIIILTLFLLEEYCYSYQSKSQSAKERVAKPFLRKTKGRLTPTRINIVDECGRSCLYNVGPNVVLQDVLQYFCSRSKVRADRVIMTHEGRKLRLSETAEEQGLADLGVVEVQTDYSKNVQDLRQQLGALDLKLERDLQMQRDAKETTEEEVAACLKSIETCKKEKKAVDREVREIETTKVRLRGLIAKQERDLQTHVQARKSAEMARNQAEQELAGDGEVTEKKKLEESAQISKQALDKVELELQTLAKSNEQVRKEQNEIEEQVREMFSKVDEREKEINRWRAKSSKVSHLRDKLEQAESLNKQISKCRKGVELAEREVKELGASFTKWKTKVAQHETNLKEVARLKAKCKSMQDEADENLKYKQEASKGFGITQSDLVNLKKSVLSGKEQEKALEQSLKETNALKQMLKGLQEEHKELNRWKLHVQKNARLSGVDLAKVLSMKPGLNQPASLAQVLHQTKLTSTQQFTQSASNPSSTTSSTQGSAKTLNDLDRPGVRAAAPALNTDPLAKGFGGGFSSSGFPGFSRSSLVILEDDASNQTNQ